MAELTPAERLQPCLLDRLTDDDPQDQREGQHDRVVSLRQWVPVVTEKTLTAVASQAAIAIENTRLFGQVQARAKREKILREITAQVRGKADVDTIMRTAAQEVGRALGRQTFVYLRDGDEDVEQVED